MKRIVLALGGNALGQTPQEQIQLVKKTAKSIVDLVEEGYEIVVGHGNGPQIGMINLAMDFASAHGAKTPYMPFPECGAMSQGYIGYHLQQAIQFELKSRKLERQAVSVITQVVVDKEDKAFQTPVKPIGMFYTCLLYTSMKCLLRVMWPTALFLWTEAILWKRENRMMLSTILKRKEQKRSWSVLPAYIPVSYTHLDVYKRQAFVPAECV